MDDKDIEILDVENYSSGKDQQFSHQQLVMMALRRSFDMGAREMKPGYFNDTFDNFGNTKRVYVDDTRKVFVEAVKTTLSIIQCDLDKDAKENIEKHKKTLKEKYGELLKEEKEYWDALSPREKVSNWSNGKHYVKNRLHPSLHFYQELLEEQVETYRNIFGELSELTKRLDFYEAEEWTA